MLTQKLHGLNNFFNNWKEKKTRRLYIRISFFFFFMILLAISVNIIVFSQSQPNEDQTFQDEFNSKYNIYALNLPLHLDFAGERVPLENYDTQESLDRELLVNTYWQSQMLLLFKKANRYFPVIEPILQKNNIPDDFKYIALVESGFAHVVSPAGASGFWQFIDKTAISYGLEINDEIDERYHLEKSTNAACRYFLESYKKFNNWTLTAASYNTGITNIDQQIKKQKTKNYYDLLLNTETARYIFRILAIKNIFCNPEKYGFHFRKKDLYPSIPTLTVSVDTSISDLSEWAHQNTTNYKMLKILNPWLRQNYLTNKEKKTYLIKIPEKGFRNIDLEEYDYINDSLEKTEKKPYTY